MVMGAEHSISADWKGLPACCGADEREGPAESALGMLGMCGIPCETPCTPPGTCSLQHSQQSYCTSHGLVTLAFGNFDLCCLQDSLTQGCCRNRDEAMFPTKHQSCRIGVIHTYNIPTWQTPVFLNHSEKHYGLLSSQVSRLMVTLVGSQKPKPSLRLLRYYSNKNGLLSRWVSYLMVTLLGTRESRPSLRPLKVVPSSSLGY